MTLYRETEHAFAQGDRVQLTAPDRGRDVANRVLGTIERIDANGRMGIRFDSGGTASFEPDERRHLDYGYAVTSHSSQGQTADRVLVHSVWGFSAVRQRVGIPERHREFGALVCRQSQQVREVARWHVAMLTFWRTSKAPTWRR